MVHGRGTLINESRSRESFSDLSLLAIMSRLRSSARRIARRRRVHAAKQAIASLAVGHGRRGLPAARCRHHLQAVLVLDGPDSRDHRRPVAAGIAELAGASDAPSPAMARIAGAVWLAAAVVVIVWPGATIGVLALVVGVALVVEGALKVVGGLRGTADQRAPSSPGWPGSSSVCWRWRGRMSRCSSSPWCSGRG